MKYKCLCDSKLSSTQSLFNHVKGSSDHAAKRRKVCEKVVEVSNSVRTSHKPLHDIKDMETEPVNAWPVNDAPASQESDCCVVVIYDPPAQDEEPAPNTTDSLKDMMRATLTALGELSERISAIENRQRSHEESLVDLKSQVSVMTQAMASMINKP
ncbi:hypothetical protein EC991_003007 [Linnemannia zychae]|nr:hypothetical protein EC991_003007 [Linnemannia zychae]